MAAPKGNKNAVGNKGGRPTKFSPKLTPAILEYFERHAKMSKKELKVHIPSFINFLLEYKDKTGEDISDDSLRTWSIEGEGFSDQMLQDKKFKPSAIQRSKIEFCGAYKRAQRMYKETLIRGGLWSAFHPTAFIFVAKNQTDMKDKLEHEVTEKHMLVLDGDE